MTIDAKRVSKALVLDSNAACYDSIEAFGDSHYRLDSKSSLTTSGPISSPTWIWAPFFWPKHTATTPTAASRWMVIDQRIVFNLSRFPEDFKENQFSTVNELFDSGELELF